MKFLYCYFFYLQEKNPHETEDFDLVVISSTTVNIITAPSNIGHIGDTNAKNKHARIKYPIYLLVFIIFEISHATIPYAYDKPNKIKVISIISWSSLISLNGNGLKNSNPKTSVANSTINKINNDRFLFNFSISKIFLV